MVAGLADHQDLARQLRDIAAPGDMVICLGPGDITKWAAGLADCISDARLWRRAPRASTFPPWTARKRAVARLPLSPGPPTAATSKGRLARPRASAGSVFFLHYT